MTPLRVALALALLLGLQTVVTDLYLPALPLLGSELHAGGDEVQMTLSALILGFGFGQLFWGPVADRCGRRPALLAGLTLQAAAATLAALAPSMPALIACRALQGATLAAAVVCARAMVRDLYPPHLGVQVMSRGLTGLGVIALLSPLIGGWSAQHFGVRAALAVVAAVSALVAIFVWRAVDETVPRRDPQATQIGVLARNWLRIARHPSFLSWAGLVAGTYGGLFVVLSISSFVLIDRLGLTRTAYGGVLAGCSLAYILGTLLCRRWAARIGAVRTVGRGALFTLAGGGSIVALWWAGVQEPWAVVVPCWFYAVGHGIHQPCGQSGVVAPFPLHAGAASALAGFLMSVVAFGIGLVLGGLRIDSTAPMALGLGLGAACTTAIAWGAVRRHGLAASVTEPAHAGARTVAQ